MVATGMANRMAFPPNVYPDPIRELELSRQRTLESRVSIYHRLRLGRYTPQIRTLALELGQHPTEAAAYRMDSAKAMVSSVATMTV
jgi:hypothetical protein